MTARRPHTAARTTRQAAELAHLQECLADAGRRADGQARALATARRAVQDADRAMAAYPALLRRVELLRAELVRVGALLAAAAPYVEPDNPRLTRQIHEALSGAGTLTTTTCPAAPVRAVAQGG